MPPPIESLLGLRIDDSRLAEALGIDGPVKTERIEDQSYATLSERGISLVLENHNQVIAVQLYAEGHQGHRQFQGQLPGGAEFGMSRERLRQTLGEPERSGAGGPVPPLGEMPPWDKWRLGRMFLHAEYEFDAESVRLFSLLPIDS